MYLVFVMVGSHLLFSHTHLHCLANNLPSSPPNVAVDLEKIYYNAIFASSQHRVCASISRVYKTGQDHVCSILACHIFM